MKKLFRAGQAAAAALLSTISRAAETVDEIRDAAEVGPRSIDSLQESPELRLAARIRSILGPRNDDTRTVPDLIDEICEQLDKVEDIARDPSKICPHCGLFNGSHAISCRECGEPFRDRQVDRMNGAGGFVPCGLCNGVGLVDVGFGKTDGCGGCNGTGRVEK